MSNVPRRLISLLLSFAMVLSLNSPVITAFAVEEVADEDSIVSYGSDGESAGNESSDDVVVYDNNEQPVESDATDGVVEVDKETPASESSDSGSSNSDSDVTSFGQDDATAESESANDVWSEFASGAIADIEAIQASDLPDDEKNEAIAEASLRLPFEQAHVADPNDPDDYPEGLEPAVDYDVEDYAQNIDSADEESGNAPSDNDASASDSETDMESTVNSVDGAAESVESDESDESTEPQATGILGILRQGLESILMSNIVGASAEFNPNEHPGDVANVSTVGSVKSPAKMDTRCGLGLRFQFCKWDDISLDGSRYGNPDVHEYELDSDDPGYKTYGKKVGYLVPAGIDNCDEAITKKSFIDMPHSGEYYTDTDGDGVYVRHPVTVRMYVWNREGTTALISKSASKSKKVAIRNLHQLTKKRYERDPVFIGLCYEFKDEVTGQWLGSDEYGYTTFLDLDRESFWKDEDDKDSVSFDRRDEPWWRRRLVRTEPEAWGVWNGNIVKTNDVPNVYGQAHHDEDPEDFNTHHYFKYYPEGFTVKQRKYSKLPADPDSGWSKLYTFKPNGYQVYGILDDLNAEAYTESANRVNMAFGFHLHEDDTGNHLDRGQLRVIYNAGTLYGFTAEFADTSISYCVNDTKANGNDCRVYIDGKWRKSGYKKDGVTHYFKNMSSKDISKISGYSGGSKDVLPYTQDKIKDSTGQVKGVRELSYYTDLTTNTAKKKIFNSKLAKNLTGKTFTSGGIQYEVVATGAWSVDAKNISNKSSAFDKHATMCLRPRGFLTDNDTMYRYESQGSTKTGPVTVRSDAWADYFAYASVSPNDEAMNKFVGKSGKGRSIPARAYRSPLNYAGGARMPALDMNSGSYENDINLQDPYKSGIFKDERYRSLTLSVTYIAMSTSTIPPPPGGEPRCGQEYTEENRATPDSTPGRHQNYVHYYHEPTYDSEGHFAGYDDRYRYEDMTCYSDVVVDLNVVDATGLAPASSGFVFELKGTSASGSSVTRTATTYSGRATFTAVERGAYTVTLIRTPDGPTDGGIPDWWNMYDDSLQRSWSKTCTVLGSPSHSSSSHDSQGDSCRGGDHDSGTVTVPFTAEYESTTLTVSQINIDAESPSYPVSTAKTGLGVWLHGKSSSGKDISIRKVVDSTGTVTFSNVPVNDAPDVNGEDPESYIVEFYETNQRPKSMFTSESWENSAQELMLEYDRGRCENTPAETELTLIPIEADFAIWTKTSQGKEVQVGGVNYIFTDVYGVSSNLGVSWNYTSSANDNNYAPGPHIGRGSVRITSVPESYMVPPTSPTMVNIADVGGIQHFDIYLKVTEINIDAIDTATQEIMDRQVRVSLINEQGNVVYAGQNLSMYQDEVPPGTYTIRVDSVPQSQIDGNGRSVHYDYPATNSQFLTFEVRRIGGLQPHVIFIDHLGSITVQKFDENGGALPGTTFKLTGRDRDGNVSEERVTNSEGKITFITTNADSSGTLVGGRNAKLKTGSHMPESRALIPGGVDHITYTLVETKTAPTSGLTLLPEQIDCTLPLVYTDAQVAATQGTDNPIDTSKGWHNDFDNTWYFFDATYRIYNDKVFAPPATGGEGNKLLGLAGVGVAGVAAGAWLLLSKRKEHAE